MLPRRLGGPNIKVMFVPMTPRQVLSFVEDQELDPRGHDHAANNNTVHRSHGVAKNKKRGRSPAWEEVRPKAKNPVTRLTEGFAGMMNSRHPSPHLPMSPDKLPGIGIRNPLQDTLAQLQNQHLSCTSACRWFGLLSQPGLPSQAPQGQSWALASQSPPQTSTHRSRHALASAPPAAKRSKTSPT